jgi:trimethylamine--corrinoid protein Co-methyltransferase
MISNTDKPLMISAVNENDMAIIYEMSCALRGGEKELQDKPFFIQYCEPTSPLKHSSTAVEKLIYCSEKHIPVVYTPAPSAGGTGPVTLAGTLSLGTAEILTGLVINQLISKGAPFIYGGVFSILDMKTMNFSYGAPEFYIFIGALADMSRYYKLPSFTTGGVSDSKIFDEQAAGEYALSLMVSYMSGSNLIHDVGYMEYGMTGCYEGILYANDIIGIVKRMEKGITVNEETLAFDVIKETGIGGYFINSDFTFDNYKNEQWSPDLIDRTSYSTWSSTGKKRLGKVLNEKVINIIENYKGHPLDSLTDKKKSIMTKCYNRFESMRKAPDFT